MTRSFQQVHLLRIGSSLHGILLARNSQKSAVPLTNIPKDPSEVGWKRPKSMQHVPNSKLKKPAALASDLQTLANLSAPRFHIQRSSWGLYMRFCDAASARGLAASMRINAARGAVALHQLLQGCVCKEVDHILLAQPQNQRTTAQQVEVVLLALIGLHLKRLIQDLLSPTC